MAHWLQMKIQKPKGSFERWFDDFSTDHPQRTGVFFGTVAAAIVIGVICLWFKTAHP